MEHLRIEQLLCFQALKTCLDFSEASEKLFITKSTLSKQLKCLENELGVVLFVRSHSNLTLTAAGEELSPQIEALLNQYSELLSTIKDIKERVNEKLRIASMYEMALYGITSLLVSFEQDKNNFHIESKECDHQQMVHLLESGATDLIIGYKELWQYSGTQEIIPLLNDELVLVANKKHPLSAANSISLKSARNEKFCFPREDASLFKLYNETCALAGFTPSLTLSDVRLTTIKRYILQGMRMTLQTRLCAETFFNEPSFQIIFLDESPSLTLSIMCNKKLTTSISKKFIDFAVNYYTD